MKLINSFLCTEVLISPIFSIYMFSAYSFDLNGCSVYFRGLCGDFAEIIGKKAKMFVKVDTPAI